MPRELSPFELDRELSRVVPRARAAYRALRAGREVTLSVPDVLRDGETLERLTGLKDDPITPPLLRWLYWLDSMQRALPLEGNRVRRYRVARHALNSPLSGHYTWRELLGHALRDAARRPALLDVLCERGRELADAGARLAELRAERPTFAGQSRAALELPCPEISEAARQLLVASADAYGSLGAETLADLLELGLAHAANDGWPRQLSLRTLNELIGDPGWLSGLRLDTGPLPAPLSATSFSRGFLRLGTAWTEALASTSQPFAIAHDPFRLEGATQGALFAGLVTSPAFLKRQLGLGKERVVTHARALAGAALIFARQLALRVSCEAPELEGSRSFGEAFSEQGEATFGFELPPDAKGLFFRPRAGDAQRLAGVLLAAERTERLAEEHDEDWFRNPRAVEQLRAEANAPPATTCTLAALESGTRALVRTLGQLL